jgi:hypothetical protein
VTLTPVDAEMVRTLIVEHDLARPRSQQTAVGPSDLAGACNRRLVYKLLGTPRVMPQRVNLSAWVGTQMHAGLEHSLAGHPQWLTELRIVVPVTSSVTLEGNLDAFHIPSGTVVDWKSTGPSAHDKYKRASPEHYLTQIALYGLGATLLGLPVRATALVYLPRSGELRDIHVDAHPWDQQRAEAAIRRYENLLAASAIGPSVLPLVGTGDACRYCPWWLPDSDRLEIGCPGHNQDPQQTALPAWEPEKEQGDTTHHE